MTNWKITKTTKFLLSNKFILRLRAITCCVLPSWRIFCGGRIFQRQNKYIIDPQWVVIKLCLHHSCSTRFKPNVPTYLLFDCKNAFQLHIILKKCLKTFSTTKLVREKSDKKSSLFLHITMLQSSVTNVLSKSSSSNISSFSLRDAHYHYVIISEFLKNWIHSPQNIYTSTTITSFEMTEAWPGHY